MFGHFCHDQEQKITPGAIATTSKQIKIAELLMFEVDVKNVEKFVFRVFSRFFSTPLPRTTPKKQQHCNIFHLPPSGPFCIGK